MSWDDMDGSDKEKLRRHMLETEQNWQCAYTELRLTEKNSDSHIDHFKRKHGALFPKLVFEYSNLFTASLDEDFGAKYKDKFVKAVADYDNLLSPSEINPANFNYNIATGAIEGNTIKAKYTIEAFNLNHSDLKRNRLERIKLLEDYKDLYPLEETIGYIGEFESLIRYIYNVNNN
ncbi:MAG: hypothetical protein JWO03_2014 [Bacteroidetes bacterium]|nr:hypothetical protein [Bacteroidota bacterium]